MIRNFILLVVLIATCCSNYMNAIFSTTSSQQNSNEQTQNQPLPAEYSAIKRIHQIAKKVAEEVIKDGTMSYIGLGKKGWPEPNRFYQQTKHGIYLTIDNYPKSLGTPYGEVTIYGAASYYDNGDTNSASYYGDAKFTQKFMSHLDLAFVRNTCEDLSESKFYLSTHETPWQEIQKKDLDQFRGTNQLIRGSHHSCECTSIYAIKKIQEMLLPELSLHEKASDVKTHEQLHKEYASLRELAKKQSLSK